MTAPLPGWLVNSAETPRVVFGLQGLQPEGSLPDATVDACLGYVRAMAVHKRSCVVGVSFDSSFDTTWLTRRLPAGLTVMSGQDVPPEGGPVVFHALSLLAERPLQRLWPAWARKASVALALSVHDDLTRQALEAPPSGIHGLLSASRYRLVARADAVVATSHSGALDAVGWAGVDPKRVFVAHECVRCPEASSSATRPPRIDGFGATGEFLLSPASTASSMHAEYVVRAFAGLAKQIPGHHQLLLASPKGESFDSRLLSELAEDARGRVIVANSLCAGEMDWLYKSCLATVIGGVEAGSARAALEAAAGGSGVVVADHDALLELVPEPDARFYPTSVQSTASMLRRCLTDHEFCRGRREETARAFEGYSEAGTAAALAVAYQSAVAGRPRRALPASAASL